jgi:hypothetical protein
MLSAYCQQDAAALCCCAASADPGLLPAKFEVGLQALQFQAETTAAEPITSGRILLKQRTSSNTPPGRQQQQQQVSSAPAGPQCAWRNNTCIDLLDNWLVYEGKPTSPFKRCAAEYLQCMFI